MQAFRKTEIRIEIWEQHDGEIEPGIQQRQLSFLQLAAAILGLQFGLNGVRVCYFATLFQSVREIQEFSPSSSGLLSYKSFASAAAGAYAQLNNGDGQPAVGDFSFSFCHGRDRGGTAKARDLVHSDVLVCVPLANVSWGALLAIKRTPPFDPPGCV